ncbi:LANO_0H02212g1_1 [Lachancea nothofagi CBS 11611]|uniref:Nicotinamide-nucleotide adenylyltransferase n=1 Tax=Lachancea nothofagi CBS 11611 TaxID=1266666 RepID=A0A1G4KL26_9SACH|nr:LANO_0H02212g1_1 [Lachancea nothofagi CBS 11611]
MDPTRAPDFEPPSENGTPNPPLAPQSTIPKSGPIMPYVLADYNASIDAPIHPRTYKKHSKVGRMVSTAHHSTIPLKQPELQPASHETSEEEDANDHEDHAYDNDNESVHTRMERPSPSPAPSQSQIYTSQYSRADLARQFTDQMNFVNPDDEKVEHIGSRIHKYQIADLEEVPHGIVRQAASLDQYSFPAHRLQKELRNPNKLPLIVVACGSFSPITYLHLRMFEMALDAISEQTRFEVVGGYYSPVSDNYQKPGLAPARHRVRMCELACERTSSWLMVDAWESLQPTYTRTAKVLDHFNDETNVKRGGIATASGVHVGVKIMLLAGGDLIESMGEPNVWADSDLHHILGNYGCLTVERTGSDVRSFLLSHDIMYEHRRNVLVIKQLIYNDISSTKVRLFIRRGMSVQYLLPNSVIRYIQEHGLYVNQTEPVKQVMGNKE